MLFTRLLGIVFIVVIFSNLTASDKETIAVLEFKNKGKSGVRFNGNDLASWMSNDLKKNDRFQPVDRKKVSKIIKEAEWLDERLSTEGEAKLRDIPAKYALYGSLVSWQSSINSSTTGTGISPRQRTPDVLPGVFVLLHFDLVDLTSGKSIKSFETEGSGLGSFRGPGPMEGSIGIDQAAFDNSFEEANKSAIRKAARTLSEEEEEEEEEEQ